MGLSCRRTSTSRQPSPRRQWCSCTCSPVRDSTGLRQRSFCRMQASWRSPSTCVGTGSRPAPSTRPVVSRPCSATCRPPWPFSSRATTSRRAASASPARPSGQTSPCWSPPVTRRSDCSPCSRRATITRACGFEAALRKVDRRVLLVAGSDDPYALRSASALAGTGSGREMLTLTDAGHGTTMLVRQPDLAGRLVDWFRRTLL